VSVAKLDQAGAFGVLGDGTIDGYAAKLIVLAFGGAHAVESFPLVLVLRVLFAFAESARGCGRAISAKSARTYGRGGMASTKTAA
jgi:hypothetical protein